MKEPSRGRPMREQVLDVPSAHPVAFAANGFVASVND